MAHSVIQGCMIFVFRTVQCNAVARCCTFQSNVQNSSLYCSCQMLHISVQCSEQFTVLQLPDVAHFSPMFHSPFIGLFLHHSDWVLLILFQESELELCSHFPPASPATTHTVFIPHLQVNKYILKIQVSWDETLPLG